MRILVSSAGLATFVSSSAPGHDESPSVFDAATTSRVARDVDESYKQRSNVRFGEECVPTPTSGSNIEGGEMDVGILCEEDLSCTPDITSSTGGRCTKTLTTAVVNGRPTQAIFRKNRRVQHILPSQPRNLQIDTPELGGNSTEEEEFVCPMNCPQDFCDCAEEFKEAKLCAEELDSICRNDQLRFCTPEKYKDFYTATYCPFAECLSVDKDPYADCACQYYRNYCTLYYDFEEVFDACEAADCCQELPTEEKHICLKELAPTTSPTGSPTMTQAPSVSPTPTDSPTAPPTSDFPSASPSAFPTGFPSESPSESPSASPSISLAPSVSFLVSIRRLFHILLCAILIRFQPTTTPTLTVEPTTSTAPTDAPSLSGQPTLPPSLLPTTSQPVSIEDDFLLSLEANIFILTCLIPSHCPPKPSASPTTPSPTLSPSKEPTKKPTKEPSASANVQNPTQSPAITDEVDEGVDAPADEDNSVAPPNSPSSDTVAKCAISALLLGVGGVFWLLA
ncbi:hypothetical protein THAOC_21967 [Thalassiosira oceanica]|uniref:Uncharacterized protein n=1 Tax=Thalassiosira oceanica TaxID=159749 RepID=K0RVU9_THAOC|nr:hypothetical protein THAOC_21967 [Thalassiosira oceanica]|eukprot:EJK57943.1 hypothetical protein THAOC_21967 [Thalassiosira oceanica]